MVQLKELVMETRKNENDSRFSKVDLSYIFRLRDRLETVAPKKINTVFALKNKNPQSREGWTQLISFSHFRSSFTPISELAKLLAPVVQETGVVPAIEPIDLRWLQNMDWNARLIYRLLNYSTVLFDKG